MIELSYMIIPTTDHDKNTYGICRYDMQKLIHHPQKTIPQPY